MFTITVRKMWVSGESEDWELCPRAAGYHAGTTNLVAFVHQENNSLSESRLILLIAAGRGAEW